MKILVFAAVGVFASQALFGQAGDKALVNDLVKHWQASKDLSLAVANAMPDDQYSFKASDAEMSFGGQMNHIAQANNIYCSMASGQTPSMEKFKDDTKAAAAKNLTAAFDTCIADIQKMTDADLHKEITMRGKQTTPFDLYWGAFTHTAHHRGQAEVYLRLKGVTPPSYAF